MNKPFDEITINKLPICEHVENTTYEDFKHFDKYIPNYSKDFNFRMLSVARNKIEMLRNLYKMGGLKAINATLRAGNDTEYEIKGENIITK